MISKTRYMDILKCICRYYGITQDKLIELVQSKEYRYMLLLILKNNNCLDAEEIKNILQVKSIRSVSNNVKSAEKTLLINSDFRRKFFDLEDNIEKM